MKRNYCRWGAGVAIAGLVGILIAACGHVRHRHGFFGHHRVDNVEEAREQVEDVAGWVLGRMDATEREIIDAAWVGEIHEFIMRTRNGYDTKIGDDGIKLSVGEKQRLAIARAVLTDPSILILDEATSSLDSLSEALIQKAMANVLKGRTSFVIAHRLSTIVNADLIVVMDQGEIVEIGNHVDLLELPDGKYRQLYEHQYSGNEEEVAAE